MHLTHHAIARWKLRIGDQSPEEIRALVAMAKPAGKRLIRKMAEAFPNSHQDRMETGGEVYVVGDAILLVRVKDDVKLVVTVVDRRTLQKNIAEKHGGRDSKKRMQARGKQNICDAERNKHIGRLRGKKRP